MKFKVVAIHTLNLNDLSKNHYRIRNTYFQNLENVKIYKLSETKLCPNPRLAWELLRVIRSSGSSGSPPSLLFEANIMSKSVVILIQFKMRLITGQVVHDTTSPYGLE